MTAVERGRLLTSSSAPRSGESVEQVARIGNLTVEQILDGEVSVPVDFVQDSDEWVVLLEGAAVLDVAGERHELGPGDWILLPARTPHRLVQVTPATNWLAVHLGPSTAIL